MVAVLVSVAAPAAAAWQDSVQVSSSASAATLTAPSNLLCTSSLGNGSLTWTPVAGATGYTVSTPLGAVTNLVASALPVTGGLLTYSLGILSVGTYSVRATAGTAWQSAASTVLVVTVVGLAACL